MDNKVDEKLLEICEFTGAGYQPVVDFGVWRVAILNYSDVIHPQRIASVERHNETDEVFVLLKGQGILFLGEGELQVEELHPQVMEAGKVYNVKQGVWHEIVLSPDASVLLVENQDTGKENSDYSPLDPKQQAMVIETAKREQPAWWR